jgi:hypothetical protein
MSSWTRASAIGFALCFSSFAQSSPPANARLIIQVRPEAALAWQGDAAVLVKVRLVPGALLTIWQEDSCSAPLAGGHVISASGIYTIQLGSIGGFRKANVCVSSNDGVLRAFLPGLPKAADGTAAAEALSGSNTR